MRAGLEIEFPHLKSYKLICQDFPPGGRYYLADISKDKKLLGYCSSHCIGAGLMKLIK